MDAPTEQDRIYAYFRVLGFSQGLAAARAGFHRTTGSRREAEPWWPDLLADVRAELIDDERKGLEPLAPKAWQVLQQRLDEGDADIAKYVIDRLYGKPLQRNENDNRSRAVVELSLTEVPDDLLRAMASGGESGAGPS